MVLSFPEINSVSARVLLSLVVPGHLIFFYIIYLVEGHLVPHSKIFVVFYLLASLMQVRMTVSSIEAAFSGYSASKINLSDLGEMSRG